MEIIDGKNRIDDVRNLIIEYTKRLNRDLSFQNIEEELKNPMIKYSAPQGEILVAIDNNEAVGMVAYHKHNVHRCEMKRLYVKPQSRGLHVGEQLVQKIIVHAKKAGFQEMVLDTIEPLQTAIHLYHKYGFVECEPYYSNPMKDVIYMKKDLL